MKYSVLLVLLLAAVAWGSPCSFNVTKPIGTITNDVVGNFTCTEWIYHFLPQEEQYQFVSVKFQSFGALNGDVEILAHDGETTKDDVIMRWNNPSAVPYSISSTQKYLTLHFLAGNTEVYHWTFNFNFSTENPLPCSGLREISGNKGVVTLNTTFSDKWTGVADCRWLLKFSHPFRPLPYHLTSVFTLESLEDPSHTMAISFYNGSTPRGSPLGAFSAEMVNSPVSSNVADTVLVRLLGLGLPGSRLSFSVQYETKGVVNSYNPPEEAEDSEEASKSSHHYLDTWAIAVICVGVGLVVLFAVGAVVKKTMKGSFRRFHDDNVPQNPESETVMFSIN